MKLIVGRYNHILLCHAKELETKFVSENDHFPYLPSSKTKDLFQISQKIYWSNSSDSLRTDQLHSHLRVESQSSDVPERPFQAFWGPGIGKFSFSVWSRSLLPGSRRLPWHWRSQEQMSPRRTFHGPLPEPSLHRCWPPWRPLDQTCSPQEQWPRACPSALFKRQGWEDEPSDLMNIKKIFLEDKLTL